MGTLLAVIAELAKTPITRDILERTRLGREIKYIRRQNQDPELNKRAKNLVREWRRIVEAEEGPAAASSGQTSNGSNGHVQHSVAAATPVVLPGRPPPPSGSGRDSPDIEVLHNNSIPVPPNVAAPGSGGSRKRSAASHTLNKRYHHRNHHTQPTYPPLSPATSRTAPASPALPRPSRGFSRHSAPSSPVCHSHNGSSHPSSPSDTPLHSGAPSSLSPASSRTTDVPVPVSSRPVEAHSAAASSRLGDASSRKHVANKRLRKDDHDDEVAEVLEVDGDEPPPKRQKVAPMTNGSVVDVEDENSVGSSASSYCEVIEDDIVVEPPPSNSAPPVWSSVQQPNRQSRASSNKDSLRYSVSSNIKDAKSPSRRGRSSSSRAGGISGAVYQAPAASDASTLPGAPRGSSYRNSASKSPVGVEDVSDADAALMPNSYGGASAHKSSASRSGRGRGRRKSSNLRPSLPDLKLPSSSSKVKTTSQLVAELAQRKGDTLLAQRASKLEEQLKSNDEMTRNKIDHVYRYVQSLPSPPDPHSSVVLVATPSPPAVSVPTSPHPSDQPITISPEPEPRGGEEQPAVGETDPTQSVLDMLGVTGEESEAELLNKLPPIDLEAAKETQLLEDRLDNLTYGHTEDGAKSCKNALEDEEGASPRPPSPLAPVALAAVERLHSSQIPCVNGTLDHASTFCEFHDVVQQQSYLDQPFNLLPYVVLDF